MSWDAFAESVTEAQRLAQPEDFDFLHRIGESYATLRRYGRCNRLSVLYFPFSETTPPCRPAGRAVAVSGIRYPQPPPLPGGVGPLGPGGWGWPLAP